MAAADERGVIPADELGFDHRLAPRILSAANEPQESRSSK